MDPQDLQETLAPRETQVRKEAKEKMAARGSLASWGPGGLREDQERAAAQARREPLGSPENQDPKEKGGIPASEVTKDLLVGRASLGTLEFQVTKATQA